jgi:VWFA-related protein
MPPALLPPIVRLATLIALLLSPLQPPQDPRQVIRTGVDLVTVDAIVVDASGVAVTDLTSADFSVRVGGRLRPVVATQFFPLKPVAEGPPIPALPPAVATASSNTALPEGRSFLVVFDVEQIRMGDGRMAAKSVADFIDTLRTQDRVGLAALPYGKPRVELTTDRKRLRDALGSIVGALHRSDPEMSLGEAVAIDRGDRRMIDEYRIRRKALPCSELSASEQAECVQSAMRTAGSILDAHRRHSTGLLDTLRALAEAMAPLPGMKTIVLASEGLFYDTQLRREMDDFSTAAARARVTLYALNLDAPLTEAGDGSRGSPPDRLLDNRVRLDGMAAVAHAGGGEVFMVTGTATAALKRIETELSGYYLLSFESDPADRGGRRREIDVRVSRRDLTVRARADFVIPAAATPAPSVPARPAPAELRESVGTLLHLPVSLSEVPLHVSTGSASPPEPGAADLSPVVITAEIPGSSEIAAVGFEITDAAQQVLRDSFEPAPSLSRRDDGAVYLAAVPLSPGSYRLKIGVVAASGRRGSVEHAFIVRPPSASAVQVGDLLIGRDTASGFEPAARVVPGQAAVDVRAEIRGSAETLASVSATLEILRAGESASFTNASMLIAGDASRNRRVATATVSAGRLPPGDYILRCTVRTDGQPALDVSRHISTVRARQQPH